MAKDRNGNVQPADQLPADSKAPPHEPSGREHRNGHTPVVEIVPAAPPTTVVHFDIDRAVPILPHAADQVVQERYRSLRTKLLRLQAAREYRSVLVTSAAPQEGKTLTVLNLALSFAMLPGFRVAVVDGDFRRGGVGKCLGAAARPGLINVLEGTATMDEVIVTSDKLPVHFIFRGTSESPDGELIRPTFLREQIRQLSSRYDLVLVDSPPANLLADAQLLASCCDAVLLVARSFVTARADAEKLAADLQPFWILGTILNGAPETQNRYKGYY